MSPAPPLYSPLTKDIEYLIEGIEVCLKIKAT